MSVCDAAARDRRRCHVTVGGGTCTSRAGRSAILRSRCLALPTPSLFFVCVTWQQKITSEDYGQLKPRFHDTSALGRSVNRTPYDPPD